MNSQAMGRLRRLIEGEERVRLGGMALRQGLITEEQLKSLDSGSDLKDWIPEEPLSRLIEEFRKNEFSGVMKARVVAMPPEVRAAAERAESVLDEFILVERLGRGGEGEVWKAWDQALARWVAVKRPAESGVEDRKRFHREALTAAGLSHPNIVPIHRVAGTEDHPYLVMQLVEGKTLADARPAARTVAEILRKVALAADYAHKQGVVHRDLKPANIMLDDRGEPRILDFGIAHLGTHRRAAVSVATVSGTRDFMPPEQAAGGPGAEGPAVDVYALGATLKTLGPLNVRLEGIAMKAMAEKPADRHPDAAAFADELTRYLATPRIPTWIIAAIALLTVLGVILISRKRDPSALGAEHIKRGESLISEAEEAYRHGVDPAALLVSAQKEIDRAIELVPGNGDGWGSRGRIRQLKARQLDFRSEPSDAEWSAAEMDFSTAVQKSPDEWKVRRAEFWARWAESQSRAGKDPRDLFDRALGDVGPDPVARAEIRVRRGDHKLRTGGDPREDYWKAEEELNGVIDFGRARSVRASLRFNLADYETAQGRNPRDLYPAAEADYSESLKQNPDDPASWLMRGCVRFNLGCRLLGADKEEGRKKFEAAAADFEEAVRRNPALEPQAGVYLSKARRFAEE